jgi:FkbM family methyltransferase
VNALHRLADLTRKSWRILRDEDALPRGALIAALWRIKGRENWGERKSRSAGVREKLFGCELRAFDRTQLAFVFEEIFLERCYRFRAARPDPVIFDCGSNIGLSIVYFKRLYPASRVVGFEASPAVFAVLKDNVERNRLQNVELHCVALDKETGTRQFYEDPDDPGSLQGSLDAERRHLPAITVQSARLSDYIQGEVDFLKLDIEGAEMAVLEELAASGKLAQVREMVIEFHHHVRPERDEMSRLLRLLEQQGYGYQMSSHLPRKWRPRAFQDILVYAYRKAESGRSATQTLAADSAQPVEMRSA